MKKVRSSSFKKKLRIGRKSKQKPRITEARRTYLLEEGTLAEMRASKTHFEQRSHFQRLFYTELAFLRDRNRDAIVEALNRASVSDFEIKSWQRTVKYKYSLHPLCCIGSVKDIGGRFNFGEEIDKDAFNPFPALYIAEDKDTALQECLGQIPSTLLAEKNFSPAELVLTNSTSVSIVSISGKLDRVIDLREPKRLQLFVDCISNFKVSPDLLKMAIGLGIEKPRLVVSLADLVEGVLDPDWRRTPREMSVPSVCQVFGQIVKSAGIEGIVYPSKLTGKTCLAVFPENFPNTSSGLKLDDEVPYAGVPSTVDGRTWKVVLQNPQEFDPNFN